MLQIQEKDKKESPVEHPFSNILIEQHHRKNLS